MATREVDIHAFFDLMNLALENGYRTPAQQRHLLIECLKLDNVFVDWSAHAHTSWTAKPCEGCDVALDIDDGDLCDECIAFDLANPLDLPGLASL